MRISNSFFNSNNRVVRFDQQNVGKIIYFKTNYTTLTFLDHALNEWITCVTYATRASWHVINNLTNGQSVTRSRTRVSAFAINTCHLTRTFAITNAFWSAIGWRSAELWHARA